MNEELKDTNLVDAVITGVYIQKQDDGTLAANVGIYEWKDGLDRNDPNFYAKTRQGHLNILNISPEAIPDLLLVDRIAVIDNQATWSD